MKYNEGDRVRIKSLDWYNENKSKSHGTVACGDKYFDYDMREWCGKIMTILTAYQTCYIMQEDGAKDLWTNEMIEGLVEEETDLNKWTGLKVELELSETVIGVSNVESLHGERFMSGFVKAIIPPEGYQFVDENDNVINATKIVLEKKKKWYPKTYEECINELDTHKVVAVCAWEKEMKALQTLLTCRDAYWKIAGDEMGLGKPWEPDWRKEGYIIYRNQDDIISGYRPAGFTEHHIFEFPTPEMRDAFKENFNPDIEICKELL